MKRLIYLILFWLLTSCSKQEYVRIPINSVFAYNEVCGDFDYMELDIDGITYTIEPYYVEIGLRGEVTIPEGEFMLTDARVYDSEGNQTYYSKGWDATEEEAVVRLPYQFTNNIMLQVWCKK